MAKRLKGIPIEELGTGRTLEEVQAIDLILENGESIPSVHKKVVEYKEKGYQCLVSLLRTARGKIVDYENVLYNITREDGIKKILVEELNSYKGGPFAVGVGTAFTLEAKTQEGETVMGEVIFPRQNKQLLRGLKCFNIGDAIFYMEKVKADSEDFGLWLESYHLTYLIRFLSGFSKGRKRQRTFKGIR